jgi:enoyl-CoA hydratase/carnithine racemase
VAESILFEVKENVGYVTFNRPEVRNAMNFEMFGALQDVINQIEKMKECRVLIFRGAGEKAFISGSDISELSKRTVQTAFENSQIRKNLFSRIEGLPIPSIAAVNGFALGIGCEIALCCTMRIASENSRFGLPEINIGILPGVGGTQRLPRLIGKSRAARLILTGRIIDASEAFSMGLVDLVVPADQLDDECIRLAGEIASKPPMAVRLILQALNMSSEAGINVGSLLESLSLGICFATEDTKEGLSAFLEKRKPKFGGQ